MICGNIRICVANGIFGRMGKKYSEEEQANHLMSLLIDEDTKRILIPHFEAMVRESMGKGGSAFPV